MPFWKSCTAVSLNLLQELEQAFMMSEHHPYWLTQALMMSLHHPHWLEQASMMPELHPHWLESPIFKHSVWVLIRNIVNYFENEEIRGPQM